MRHIILIFIASLIFLKIPVEADEMIQELQVNEQDLMQEIKDRINSTAEPHPWVSDIVEEYIPLNTDQNELLRWCEKEGYEITDLTNENFSKGKLEHFDSIQRCSKEFWIPRGWFWKHALSMSFDFEGNKLKRIRARVGYKHPWY